MFYSYLVKFNFSQNDSLFDHIPLWTIYVENNCVCVHMKMKVGLPLVPLLT